MNKKVSILLSLTISFVLFSCKNNEPNSLENCIDYWVKIQTIYTNKKAILVVDTIENKYKIKDGQNQVLIIEVATYPKFKNNCKIPDAYSTKKILIEFNSKDLFSSPKELNNSKIYIQRTAMIPERGIKRANKNDIITISRKNINDCEIHVNCLDIILNGNLNFEKDQRLESETKWDQSILHKTL